jgi:hypothetical protein
VVADERGDGCDLRSVPHASMVPRNRLPWFVEERTIVLNKPQEA